MNNDARKAAEEPSKAAHLITIFMCGDVMTGRGIDQVLPHPSAPVIYEPYLKSARGYVEIAEEANGPIPQPVNFSYIWGDALVVASIHWGGNWGYEVPHDQTEFAHKLIDAAGVDVIHGHSSHHVKGMEVYKDKLILYGCGDFLNDYEGIRGYEVFRDDLGLMYFASVDPSSGKLIHLRMSPTQIKRFRVNRASRADALWLKDILNREGKKFGTRTEMNPDNTLAPQWD